MRSFDLFEVEFMVQQTKNIYIPNFNKFATLTCVFSSSKDHDPTVVVANKKQTKYDVHDKF